MKHYFALSAMKKAEDINKYLTEVLNQEHIKYTPGVLDEFKKPMFIGDINSHYIAMSLNEAGRGIRCIDLERMNFHKLRYKLIVVETEGNFEGFEVLPNAIHGSTPDMFRKERHIQASRLNTDLIFWMVLNKPEVKVFDITEIIEQHLKFMKKGKGDSFLKVKA